MRVRIRYVQSRRHIRPAKNGLEFVRERIRGFAILKCNQHPMNSLGDKIFFLEHADMPSPCEFV
jgi:hypothetical protein